MAIEYPCSWCKEKNSSEYPIYFSVVIICNYCGKYFHTMKDYCLQDNKTNVY